MMLQKQKRCCRNSLIAFAIMCSCATQAQVLAPDVPANRYLLLAEEQYRQAHYAMAAQSARAIP